MSSSGSSPPASSTASFVTALVTDLIIFGIIVSIFIYVRSRAQYDWLYKSRLQPDTRKLNQAKPVDIDKQYGNNKNKFSWITSIISISDDVLLHTAGLDALMYNYFFLLCVLILGIYLIFALGIILPVNVTGEMASTITGFDQLSMATIADNSPRIAAHVICFCILLTLVLLALYRMYVHYLGLRRNYIKTAQLQGNELTIMIRNLPDALCDTDKFQSMCEHKFGDTLKSIYLPIDCSKLHDTLQDRSSCCDQLEQYIAKTERDQQQGKSKQYKKTVWTWKIWKIHRMNAIEYYEQELKQYNTHVNELLQSAKSRKHGELHVGFVTLYSSVAYSNALTEKYIRYDSENNTTKSIDNNTVNKSVKKLLLDKNVLQLERAPMPEDIYYPNLVYGSKQLSIRYIIITIALWALVFFYTIPIAAVSALTTLPNLEKLAPPISIVINVSPVVKGLISGFLPSVALLVFQALLPSILLKMSKIQGIVSYTQLDMSVFQKYYIFQFVNFYLITIFAGLLLNVIKQVISNPSIIPTLFGESMPLVATEFLNYILINTFISLPLALLLIVPLLMGLYSRHAAVTKRDLIKAKQPQLISYGTYMPMHLLIFIICMGYSVIQPLITLFGLLYFSMGYFIVRYNLLYTSAAKYDAGGLYFPMVFNRMMAALILAELTLIGLFGVKKSTGGAVVMVLPLLITIIYTYWINRNLRSQVDILSQQNAQLVDVRLQYEQQYINELGAVDKNTTEFNPYIQCELSAPVVLEPFKNLQDCGLENDVVQLLGDVGRGDIKTLVAARGAEFMDRTKDIHTIHSNINPNEQHMINKYGTTENNSDKYNDNNNNRTINYNETTTNQNSVNYEHGSTLHTPRHYNKSNIVPDNENNNMSSHQSNTGNNPFEQQQSKNNQYSTDIIDNVQNKPYQSDDTGDVSFNNDTRQPPSTNIFERPAVSNNATQFNNIPLSSNQEINTAVQRENVFPTNSKFDMFASPAYDNRALDNNNTPITSTEQKLFAVFK